MGIDSEVTFHSFDHRTEVYEGYTVDPVEMSKLLVYLKVFYSGSLVTENDQLTLFDSEGAILASVSYKNADSGLMRLVLDTVQSPVTPE